MELLRNDKHTLSVTTNIICLVKTCYVFRSLLTILKHSIPCW